MSPVRNIYLDTNAIIHFAEGEEDILKPFFIRGFALGVRFFTSEITLAEVMVVPMREKNRPLVEKYENSLRSDALLTVVEVDRSVLLRSAELRANHGGHAVDAIHVASAELGNCELLISSDERLRIPRSMRRVAIRDVNAIGI